MDVYCNVLYSGTFWHIPTSINAPYCFLTYLAPADIAENALACPGRTLSIQTTYVHNAAIGDEPCCGSCCEYIDDPLCCTCKIWPVTKYIILDASFARSFHSKSFFSLVHFIHYTRLPFGKSTIPSAWHFATPPPLPTSIIVHSQFCLQRYIHCRSGQWHLGATKHYSIIFSKRVTRAHLK